MSCFVSALAKPPHDRIGAFAGFVVAQRFSEVIAMLASETGLLGSVLLPSA